MDMVAGVNAQLSTLALGPADGEPVVMLHGLVSGNMATWYSPVASPLSATRRVVLYDQRGHGSSSLPSAGFDLDSQVADLQAVLAHHGLADAVVDLVGHSMGALIALRFALRYPNRVRRLILVDAPMPARDCVGPSLLGVTSREALAAWVDSHLAGAAGLGGRRKARLLQRLDALFFESTLVADVLAMGSESESELAALKQPVLLVYGRHSPCLESGRHLQRTLPMAQLVLLDCGHYIPEEAPVALLAGIRQFLEERTLHEQK